MRRFRTGRSVVNDKTWAEVFPEREVWNEGRALIARLRTESSWYWAGIVFSGDKLLWHE